MVLVWIVPCIIIYSNNPAKGPRLTIGTSFDGHWKKNQSRIQSAMHECQVKDPYSGTKNADVMRLSELEKKLMR